MNEGKKDRREPIRTKKPRSAVAQAVTGMSGAGAHKDKKKAIKQGDVKHKKKEYMEHLADSLKKAITESQDTENDPFFLGYRGKKVDNPYEYMSREWQNWQHRYDMGRDQRRDLRCHAGNRGLRQRARAQVRGRLARSEVHRQCAIGRGGSLRPHDTVDGNFHERRIADTLSKCNQRGLQSGNWL